MTLEQVNALVTMPELNNVIKDGMCLSEPILCQYEDKWIDVYFTYGIYYMEEKYSGPIAVVGINSEEKRVVFTDFSNRFMFSLSAKDVVEPKDWEEKNAVYYEEYASSYNNLRQIVLNNDKSEYAQEMIKSYLDLLQKYVDQCFWSVYSILLKDIYEYIV